MQIKVTEVVEREPTRILFKGEQPNGVPVRFHVTMPEADIMAEKVEAYAKGEPDAMEVYADM